MTRRPPAFDQAAGAAYQQFQEMTMPRKRRSTAAKKDRETDRRQERQARLERQRARDALRRSDAP